MIKENEIQKVKYLSGNYQRANAAAWEENPDCHLVIDNHGSA